MLKVKICGVTSVSDAALCARLGADYVGLIFAKSPRRVDVQTARDVVQALPRGTDPVGVFLDQPLEEVRRIAAFTGLRLAQLHGAETPAYARALGLGVIKTFDAFNEAALERLKKYDAFAFLLDVPKGAGPRGRAAIDPDWALLAKRHGKVMLAGRLDPQNVGELVRRVRPWGVDTCRCTESAPGVKDEVRVRAFIQAARLAQRDGARLKVRTR